MSGPKRKRALSARELIKLYGLKPHPEGGYFRETYRSAGTVRREALPGAFKGDRHYGTAIYYLLPRGAKSTLHRLATDEVFHFYLGGPMTLVQISPEGGLEKITLGSDVRAGQRVQHVVPAGFWFGGFPNPGTAFSLVGCTVAPGFDFADFEIGGRRRLIKKFPHAKKIIDFLYR